MSKIKAFIEEVSVRHGHDGEINEEVLEIAQQELEKEGKSLFVSNAQKRRLNHQFNKNKDK